jgi:hypothetical protein
LDGDRAWIRESGASFVFHGVPPWAYGLVYIIADIGDMTIIPTGRGVSAIALREEQLRHMPAEFREQAAFCRSPRELSQLLASSIQSAEAYRQQILKMHGDPPG